MRFPRVPVLAGLLLTAGWLAPAALAQTAPAGDPAAVPAEADSYSRDGADTCIKCHDGPEILSLFKTAHGTRAAADSPFAAGQLQCEACHGPGGAHSGRVRSGQPRPAILTFGSRSKASPQSQNQSCLGCHDGAVQDCLARGRARACRRRLRRLASRACATGRGSVDGPACGGLLRLARAGAC